MIHAHQLEFSIKCRGEWKRLVQLDQLHIPRGKFTALIGPNGAGKTTLLNLLSGDLTPHKGSILLDGRSLKTYSILELAYKRSVLPQIQYIPFAINIRAILLMGIMPYNVRVNDPRVTTLFDEIATQLQLEHLLDQSYQTLSGGEQHRAQLGRILMQSLFAWKNESANNDRLMLLDEPFNHLDLYHQHALLRYLTTLVKEGMTVVSVMHDLNQALLTADHLIVMSKGQLHGSYTPHSLRENRLLTDIFGVEFTTLSDPNNQQHQALFSYLPNHSHP